MLQNPAYITKFLDGNHVHLRAMTKEDLVYIDRRYNHPKIRKGHGAKIALNPEILEKWFDKNLVDNARIDMTISPQRDYEVIGTISLFDIDWLNRNARIEVTVPSQSYQNKGFASEAVYLVIEHSFETLNLYRIEVQVPAYNSTALAVAEKIGFSEEGVRKSALFYEGQYHDIRVLSLLQPQFMAAKNEGKYLKFKDFQG